MMTFEEFFKKKRIDLPQLRLAEPGLFAEFEQHYNQMGEKSFDHTKKYWFNQLRRKYHTPDDVKVEKVVIENKLAEQTITEALSERPAAVPTPKVGFKPRFNAAAKPVEPVQETPAPENQALPEPETIAPKLGFKPKFKTAITAPIDDTVTPVEEQSNRVPDTEALTPKLGFKPKFKSVIVPSTPVDDKPLTSEKKPEPTSSEEAPAPKLGFKPKFKPVAASTTPVEDKPAASEEKPETPSTTETAPKLGFIPKFKAMPKPIDKAPEQTVEAPKIDEITETQSEVKPAYKPKFQARNLKPKD